MTKFPIETKTQRDVIIVEVAFCIIPTIAVGLRLYARKLKGVSLDWSDACIVAALCLTIGFLSLGAAAVVECGIGLHLVDIIQEHGMAPVTKFLKMLIAVQILWACSLSLVKASILFFYLRIFNVPAFRLAARLTGVFIALWAITVILCGFLMCRPFAYTWNQTIPGGKCGNQVLSYVITGALNLVTDVIVLLLPMPHIWSLQMPLAKRLILTATFMVGIFVCVISILRLISLQELSYTDITYDIPHALIWGTLEPAIGITLACVPIMRPIFIRNNSSQDRSRSRTTGDRFDFKVGSGHFKGKSLTSHSDLQSKDFELLENDQRPLRADAAMNSHKIWRTTDVSVTEVSDDGRRYNRR